MHMSDALITPLVGGTTLAASGGAVGYCVKSIKAETFEEKLPLMGVMGAFIFAAQMINFAIPGTGSSGHIGGGMLLSIILGPAAAFITLACVLLIQALFFADGGLLALGCNLINLGLMTAFLAYPLVFRPIYRRLQGKQSLMIASIAACVIGLQLGSFGVVIETWLSGRSELPLTTFILFMAPIHLAIGLVEGVITGLVVVYVHQNNSLLIYDYKEASIKKSSTRRVLASLLVVAILLGGVLSLYASNNPDGLEWAIANTAGTSEVINDSEVHGFTSWLQNTIAPLKDYSIKGQTGSLGTSVSGIVGSLLTLLVAVIIGKLIKRRGRA